MCVLGYCGEYVPYANDDYPVLGHRSVQILSEGDGKRGKIAEDPYRRKFGIGRTCLGQKPSHRNKHEQTGFIPSRTFVSAVPFVSSAHPFIHLVDLINHEVGTQCRI